MRLLHWLLLCLGVLFLLLANVLFWINGTLLDSESFSGAVDETMAKPEVQDLMATVISQEAAPESRPAIASEREATGRTAVHRPVGW